MKNGSKRTGAVILLIMVAVVVLSLQRQQKETVYIKDMFAMDTYFSLKAYGSEGEEALKLCEDKIIELEGNLSVTKSDSDVGRLNTEGENRVSEDTFYLIQEALALCRETDGALDITLYPVLRAWGFTTNIYCVPSESEITELLDKVDYRKVVTDTEEVSVGLPKGAEIDLGAVAKGYTGDCLLEILRKQGVTSAMVDLGGNVQVLGSKPDGSPWKVAVRNPMDTGSTIGVLEITDKAVITSGSYERYFEKDGERYWHILNPADGYPADSGLVSVTVVGDSGVRCDGLSTALFVMGKEQAVDFWRQAGDFEMLLVTEDGQLYVTEGLQESFTCSEEWLAEVIYK